MKMCPVGAELFRADGWTDGKTWKSQQLLFVILLKHLKKATKIT